MSSKQYFDNVAKQWDQMRQNFFSEEVRNKAYEIANIEEGGIAADIGAGTGFITEGLITMGVKIIAVDQSEEMLAEMQKKFKNIDSIEYRVGDARSIPINDSTVDYVFANMFLHHVEDPKAVIKEMTRILKPGGRIVITDLDLHDYEFLVEEQQDRWMGFKREDIKQWYIDAGIKNILIDCVGANCCSESSCGYQKASISIFIATGIK